MLLFKNYVIKISNNSSINKEDIKFLIEWSNKLLVKFELAKNDKLNVNLTENFANIKI